MPHLLLVFLSFLLCQPFTGTFAEDGVPGRRRPISFREAKHIPQVRFVSGRRAVPQCEAGALLNLAKGLGVRPELLWLTSQQVNFGLTFPGYLDLLISSGNLDTASDLLTGFATSRLMGAFLGRQFTQGSGQMWWKVEARNMWEGVCESYDVSHLLDFDPQWAFCNIVNAASTLLGCKEVNTTRKYKNLEVSQETPLFGDVSKLTCESLPDPTMLSNNNYSLSLRLMPYSKNQEVEPRPARIVGAWGLSKTPSFLRELGEIESPIYLALYLATQRTLKFQRSHLEGVFEFGMESVVSGWEPVLEFGARQEGEASHELYGAESIGVGSLHRRRNPYYKEEDVEEDDPFLCEFLVVVRELETEFDWKMAFASQLEPMLPAPRNSKEILVHRGVNVVSEGLLVPLVGWLNRYVFGLEGGREASCAPEKTMVTLTGASLGGSVAAVLAVKLAVSYEEVMELSVVTFGAVRAFNAEGVAYYDRVARVRSVRNALDALSEYPCSAVRGQKRCGMRRYMHLEGFGEDETLMAFPNSVEYGMTELNGHPYWSDLLTPGTPEKSVYTIMWGIRNVTNLEQFRSEIYHSELVRRGCNSKYVRPSFVPKRKPSCENI